MGRWAPSQSREWHWTWLTRTVPIRRSLTSTEPGSSSSSSTNPTSSWAATKAASNPTAVPPSFTVYSTDDVGGRHYMIGETRSRPPLYAVSLHAGWKGPDVELHSGPSESEPPPLATAKRGSLFGDGATVQLPGPDGGGGMVKEKVDASNDFPYPSYGFAIEVEQGQQREEFRWVHIGMRKGWQLARLSTSEVVAVFDWTTLTKKELYFQFVGHGGTGILGERWAIMAVITAIRAWDRVKRKQASGAV
ncbi:uncharacterized protein PG998_008621 [Apiospora kogelbergensis]|uniref:uncharacterized protein n=1 Tax=Apiospora kogelbergensis TaxID=1337665 RepID=UPI003130C295